MSRRLPRPLSILTTGHAGAMLQARQLGRELYVGVHSDAEILHNKGPVVMKMDERLAAVNACKWSTRAVANAPYVTDPGFMAEYGCKYVVHGDDITTDANGEDCYKDVKEKGLFVVVKRTPNILTTDLVGRMLLMNKAHHYQPLLQQGPEHVVFKDMASFRKYASDCTGLHAGAAVYVVSGEGASGNCSEKEPGQYRLERVVGAGPALQERLANGAVYIDGGFDLFHPGHIEALRLAAECARAKGLAVMVGIHEDHVVNQHKGLNYPIMNLFERCLCVLQCRYVDALVVGAPYMPSPAFLHSLPARLDSVVHGPTPQGPQGHGGDCGMVRLPDHKYSHMNTEFIVQRVLSNKKAYEERQKRKGWKGEVEERLKEAEGHRGDGLTG